MAHCDVTSHMTSRNDKPP